MQIHARSCRDYRMSLGVDELDVHAKTMFDSFCNICFMMFCVVLRLASQTFPNYIRLLHPPAGSIE